VSPIDNILIFKFGTVPTECKKKKMCTVQIVINIIFMGYLNIGKLIKWKFSGIIIITKHFGILYVGVFYIYTSTLKM
jgi:hypothetical protein